MKGRNRGEATSEETCIKKRIEIYIYMYKIHDLIKYFSAKQRCLFAFHCYRNLFFDKIISSLIFIGEIHDRHVGL